MSYLNRKQTAWKKNRTFGDIMGGRMRPKLKDNIHKRLHSLQAPSQFEEIPILMADNPSRDYFFPASPEEIRNALQKFPDEKTGLITHIWQRKYNPRDNVQGYVVKGSGVYAIVLYPMRKDLKRYLGKTKPTEQTKKWYEGFASISMSKDGWYAHFYENTVKQYFLEHLLPDLVLNTSF